MRGWIWTCGLLHAGASAVIAALRRSCPLAAGAVQGSWLASRDRWRSTPRGRARAVAGRRSAEAWWLVVFL
eukprot:4939485-Heterocapsa_arctica.AAC.1